MGCKGQGLGSNSRGKEGESQMPFETKYMPRYKPEMWGAGSL